MDNDALNPASRISSTWDEALDSRAMEGPCDSPPNSAPAASPLRAFGSHRVQHPWEGKVDTRRRRKLKAQSKELPRTPGVYFFFGHKDRLLYIGKAKRLRERVGSYFADTKQKRPPKLRRLLAEIERMEVQRCGSELEALLLERKLIAERRPLLNRQLKRFDVYPYLLLSDEAFPRLTLTRAEPTAEAGEDDEPDFFAPKDASALGLPFGPPGASSLENPPRVGELPGLYLGPFTTPKAAWWTFEAVRALFPLRSCEGAIVPDENGRGCFYRELKRCCAPCVGESSREEYARLCQDLVRTLHEGTSPHIEALRARMMRLAEEWKFEDAAKIKAGLEAIEHVANRLQRLQAMREKNNVAIVQPALDEASDEPLDGASQVLGHVPARRWSVFLIQNGLVRRHLIVRDADGAWDEARRILREVYEAPIPAKPFTAKAELDEMMILDRWLRAHGTEPACVWLHERTGRQWLSNAVRGCRRAVMSLAQAG